MAPGPRDARMDAGWREWVSLPTLGIRALKAKLDTGARTCALRVAAVRAFRRDGTPMVSFRLLPPRGRVAAGLPHEARITGHRVVSDSGGHRQRRWVIRTRLGLGGRTWPVDVTLAPADGSTFRMLVGRSAMRGRLVVHPDRKYLLGRKPVRPARRKGRP